MFLRLGRLLKMCGRNALVLFHACRRPETPIAAKLATALVAIYVISPVDLIPDVIPILGWIDDATILAFALPAILKLVPRTVIDDATLASDRTLSKWSVWRRKS